jgi:hypothetical protein
MAYPGRNELHLNTATIIEAVQLYLNRNAASKGPKVTDVTFNQRTSGCFFVVTVEGRPDTPEGGSSR